MLNCSRVRLDQARGQLQNQRFSRTALPYQNLGFRRSHGKRHSVQHVAFVETNAHVFEEDRTEGCVRAHAGGHSKRCYVEQRFAEHCFGRVRGFDGAFRIQPLLPRSRTTGAIFQHLIPTSIIDGNTRAARDDCEPEFRKRDPPRQHQLGEEEIGDQNEHRGCHHGLRGGPARPLAFRPSRSIPDSIRLSPE